MKKFLILLTLNLSSVFAIENLPELNTDFSGIDKFVLLNYQSDNRGDLRAIVNSSKKADGYDIEIIINRIKQSNYDDIKKNVKNNVVNNAAHSKKFKLETIYEKDTDAIMKITDGTNKITLLSFKKNDDITLFVVTIYNDAYKKLNDKKWIKIWSKLKLSKNNKPIIKIKKYNLAETFQVHKANYILLVKSQAIDDYPVWTTDEKGLIFNVQGKWNLATLDGLWAYDGVYRKSNIAVITNLNTQPVDEKTVKLHKQTLKYGNRSVTLKNGDLYELRQEGLSTKFIKKKDGKETILWVSDMENCYSLSVSPSEKYIAYISELNGIVIYKPE